jgi:DNA polymerase-3 subunit delta
MDAAVKKILTDIKGGKYAPVYFLQGEESFYIDLIADHIEKHALSEAEKGFNQVVLYGKDVTMAAILTNARRFPMMAERQVVIVKEAQDIQDLNRESGSKLLLDYLGRKVPSTVLVFCHKHKTLDKRKELGKKIDQLTVALNTKKLYDNQLPEFVNEYTAERKIPIEDQAIRALCEFVGNDLHRLANEIDKLIISLQPGEAITANHVMSQVGVSKEYNIFELQRAILQRDHVLANKMAASQVGDKSDKGIASELKVSPYAARDYSSALRVFQTPKIIDIISSLKEADLKLKGVNTGSADEGQIVRELVWRIMN